MKIEIVYRPEGEHADSTFEWSASHFLVTGATEYCQYSTKRVPQKAHCYCSGEASTYDGALADAREALRRELDETLGSMRAAVTGQSVTAYIELDKMQPGAEVDG